MSVTINGNGTISGYTPTTISGTLATSSMPVGSIIQVKNAIKTDTGSAGESSNYVDISGLSVAITPTSSSNKILISCNITAGHSATSNVCGFRLMRDSTAIAVGDAVGNRRQWTVGEMTMRSNTNNTTHSVGGTFLDSPGVDTAVTYKLQLYNRYNTIYINRSGEDSNSDNHGRGVSAITVMEVVA